MPRCAVNGTELYYEVTGESGPPLVLVHGGFGAISSDDPGTIAFARNLRVVAYDRRGHGRSQPQHELTADGLTVDVDDLAALIKALDLGPVHLAGSSSGGSTVLHFALRYPELVRSIVVMEPPMLRLIVDDPVLGAEARRAQAGMASGHKLLASGDVEAAIRHQVGLTTGNPDDWDTFPTALQEMFRANASSFTYDLIDPDVFGIDLARLSTLTIPTLLTSVDQSPRWFAGVVATIAAAMPSAAVHVFGGSPHMPNPDEYVATLTEFVLRHS